MAKLSGKVAVVTGGNSGIGLATAKRLQEEGAKVAVSGRSRKTLDEAVKRAQEIGVAETDPSADLDGWDATVKVAALIIVLMGVDIKLEQIDRTGIRNLSPEEVRGARDAGMRYKLICRAERTASGVRASVKPEQLPLTDPLALLDGTTSAVRFDMDVFGLSIIEHKATVIATAYGLLGDFIRAVANPS